jgi:hypothetical protein
LHTLSDLSQVLETAVEYGVLAQNPAAGKRQRLKSTRPARPWVEPAQPSLLDAASGVGRVLSGSWRGPDSGSARRSRCAGSTSTSRPDAPRRQLEDGRRRPDRRPDRGVA